MFKLLIVSALISVAASHAIVPLAAPAPFAVPALAAVPTLTAVHQQRLIPQPPAVHSVASPTTVLQTVQTGTAVVGHQKVGDQVVGKTADVNGYAFRSDVRHDAPAYAPVVAAPLAVAGPAPIIAAPAPVVAAAAPVALAGPAPALAPAALAGPQTIHPAPPALSKSYATEIGHTVAHDHIVTSPVIKNTVHSPVFGSQPIVAQVPVAAPLPAPILAPAPLPVAGPLPAY